MARRKDKYDVDPDLIRSWKRNRTTTITIMTKTNTTMTNPSHPAG